MKTPEEYGSARITRIGRIFVEFFEKNNEFA